MGESYATLIVQPIDLINAFKLDFCLASVIKWMTKWHMENKAEYLRKVCYYIDLCHDSEITKPFMFALRLYCMVNGFLKKDCKSCELLDIVTEIKNSNFHQANVLANRFMYKVDL